MTRRAFTLIELLVVIAIIAILAAILFPVFASAKEAAKKASCLSNQKQNAMAVMMYNDNSEGMFAQSVYAEGGNGVVGATLPQTLFSVFDALQPYMKNKDIFVCPSDTKAVKWCAPATPGGPCSTESVLNYVAPGGFRSSTDIGYAGFAPNFALFEDPAVAPNLFDTDPTVNENRLESPAETVMFYDARYIRATTNPDAPTTSPYYNVTGNFSGVNFPGTARHSGQATINLNFADGHAKSYGKRGNIPGTATDYNGNANVKVYNLPYDLSGIPGFRAEGRT